MTQQLTPAVGRPSVGVMRWRPRTGASAWTPLTKPGLAPAASENQPASNTDHCRAPKMAPFLRRTTGQDVDPIGLLTYGKARGLFSRKQACHPGGGLLSRLHGLSQHHCPRASGGSDPPAWDPPGVSDQGPRFTKEDARAAQDQGAHLYHILPTQKLPSSQSVGAAYAGPAKAPFGRKCAMRTGFHPAGCSICTESKPFLRGCVPNKNTRV